MGQLCGDVGGLMNSVVLIGCGSMAIVIADMICEINNKSESNSIEIVGVVDDRNLNQLSNLSKIMGRDILQYSELEIAQLKNIKLVNCIAGNLETRAAKFNHYK